VKSAAVCRPALEGRGYTSPKPGEPGSGEATTPRGAIASTQPGSPGFDTGIAPPFEGGADLPRLRIDRDGVTVSRDSIVTKRKGLP